MNEVGSELGRKGRKPKFAEQVIPAHALLVEAAIRSVTKRKGRAATYSELRSEIQSPSDSKNPGAWKDANLQRGLKWLLRERLVIKEGLQGPLNYEGDRGHIGYRISNPLYFCIEDLMNSLRQNRDFLLNELSYKAPDPKFIEREMDYLAGDMAEGLRLIQEGLLLTYWASKDPAGHARNWRPGYAKLSKKIASQTARKLSQTYRKMEWEGRVALWGFYVWSGPSEESEESKA